VKLPDPEIPPLGKIHETLAWLRETRDRIDALIEGFEYLEQAYEPVVKEADKLLSVAETARLVTGQLNESRARRLLKAFVTDLDDKGDAWEKDRPSPPSPLGYSRPARVRLLDSFEKNEPFWTREICLVMRPHYQEWYEIQPEAKHGRKKS
jgi:hypothetical protein